MKPFRLVVCALLMLFGGSAAYAQQVPFKLQCSGRQERVADHYLCVRDVVIERDNTKLFADQVEGFENDDRVIATGNVLFVQGRNQISADRADFNTKTKQGTFWGAWGIASIQPPRSTPLSGGFVAPQMTNQDTDVYFFGDIVEKLGAKKYRITRGAFTTCLQPEPRWEFHADRVTLNVDDYALLHQAIFNVKGVPVLYVPIFYYPINKEGRATGFLIPSYSATTLRGSSIRNEFFWAIGRSHDATFTYDWYAKTGQGYGGEYRYNIGSGSGSSLTIRFRTIRPPMPPARCRRAAAIFSGATPASGFLITCRCAPTWITFRASAAINCSAPTSRRIRRTIEPTA